MRPPEEVLLKYILPNIRGLLAHALRRRGYSQSRISSVLGVSQAAVSGYLLRSESTYIDKLKSFGIPVEEIDVLVNSLVSAASEGAPRLTQVIHMAWRKLLSSGYICGLHRRLYPELADCEVCIGMEVRLPLERERILEELRLAAEVVERSPELLLLYPEVSINIATALDNASSLNDVAAFPGRIVRIGTRMVPVSKPAFGASKHLASILLGSIRINAEKKSIMNLKMVKGVEEVIKSAGLIAVSTQPNDRVRSEDEVVFDVIEALKRNPEADVVVDEGGLGLEPAVYVFGKSPIEVVNKACSIARRLRGSGS
ncbi:Bifunctional thiamine biosynthesis protein ThiDN [Candidatus Calditenuaceae archaeon HR02]|nr:Bifunctional thiamine biosynthesis protein ThiDN [Candidatus Calditenuaceae archaeon HR02]